MSEIFIDPDLQEQPQNPAHRLHIQTLAIDSILTGSDMPAPDILNKAEIRRDDDPPALTNSLLHHAPFNGHSIAEEFGEYTGKI